MEQNSTLGTRARKLLGYCVPVVCLAACIYGAYGPAVRYWSASRRDAIIDEVVSSEELMHRLADGFVHLERSVLNLRLPDSLAVELFSQQVGVVDLATDRDEHGDTGLSPALIRQEEWQIASSEQVVDPRDLEMWRALFNGVTYFEHAAFRMIRGQFVGDDRTDFEAEVKFVGLARSNNGEWNGVKALQKISWRQTTSTGDSQLEGWQIHAWRLLSFDVKSVPRRWFSEVLDAALPRPRELKRARQSIHEQMLTSQYTGTVGPRALAKYDPYFAIPSTESHPGVSVVDVDGDGLDDLYIMPRWGLNQLLRNRGDGTFEDIAPQLGLDVDSHSTSAIFADFDNDGDKDVIIGRYLERSMYLVNKDGRFVDRSLLLVSTPLPAAVTSISAADYNGDGLLDVYMTTYPPSGDYLSQWAAEFLSEEEASELMRQISTSHRYIDLRGPPNVLLENQGDGRFGLARKNQQLQMWQASFQASWADYDEDGDPDLYVANDFGPDHLFRNDYPQGFADITQSHGHETMQGFGMGVAWGDYDGDGRQDLYVSNMYSKAGRRITRKFAGLDSRFVRSADGNRLYRYDGQSFQLVSGFEPEDIPVGNAGWSWGGQFFDVDNDGRLDLYVSSGYFTAPAGTSTHKDL
jgi:hypothetical protein